MSTATTASNGSLNDFFHPLNPTNSGGSTMEKKGPKSPRSRSVKFADEKAEAQLMLESILLFEPDASFNDPSVVEAVMEDFHDSCSSFDSWEYAFISNCPAASSDDDSEDSDAPSMSWMELEQLVKEQQLKEWRDKHGVSESAVIPEEKEVPLEINAGPEEQPPLSPMPVSPKKKIISSLSPSLSPQLHISPTPPQRSPKQNTSNSPARKPKSEHLQKALENSSSLRHLEEAAKARRQREEQERQKKAAQFAREKKEKEEAELQWLQQGASGDAVRQRRASFEARKATPARAKSLPVVAPKRLSIQNSPFEINNSKKEEEEEEPVKPVRHSRQSRVQKDLNNNSGPGLRRSNTAEEPTSSGKENNPKKQQAPLIRRVRTHEPSVSRHKSMPAVPLLGQSASPKNKPKPRRTSRSSFTATRASLDNTQSVLDRRQQELQAAKEASLVEGNAFNKRERLVVQLQAAVRGWLVRTELAKMQEKVKELQDQLQELQRAHQLHLHAIRNSPELTALRDEYQTLAWTDKQKQIEQERKVIKEDMASYKDDNQNIRSNMEQLEVYNKKIAKSTREKEYQCTCMQARNASLQKTQEHIQAKVNRVEQKFQAVKKEIATVTRTTETERQVGRICQTTILKVRAHVKTVAATSDDAFLKKVAKRSKILEKLQKNKSNDPHEQAMGACPVVLSR